MALSRHTTWSCALTLRKAQKIVRKEMVILCLQIVATIVFLDDHSNGFPLLTNFISGRVTFDVRNGRVFRIFPATPTDRLNTAVTVCVIGKFSNASNATCHCSSLL